MKRLFKRKISEWENERLVAHWILQQILKNSNEAISKEFIYDSGNIIFPRGETILDIERREANLASLVDVKRHSLNEITNALNLLLANKHIKVSEQRDGDFESLNFCVEPAGMLAFKQDFYKEQIAERRANWPKRNWLAADMIKLASVFSLAFSLE